jgi:hypothetical protein
MEYSSGRVHLVQREVFRPYHDNWRDRPSSRKRSTTRRNIYPIARATRDEQHDDHVEEASRTTRVGDAAPWTWRASSLSYRIPQKVAEPGSPHS